MRAPLGPSSHPQPWRPGVSAAICQTPPVEPAPDGGGRRDRAPHRPVTGAGRRAGRRPGRADRLTHLEVLPPRDAELRRVAGVGGPRGASAALADRGIAAALAAPGGRRGRRPRGPARRAGHGHRVGQVARLPAARADGDPRAGAGRAGNAAPRSSTSPPPRRSPTTSGPRCAPWASTSGPPPTTVTPRASSATGPATFGEYVLTNPDMLHRSLLPGHERWAGFFGSLRYVVVDECHHYRGVFGAHVAHVHPPAAPGLRARTARHPTFVLASATVAEPEVAGRPADRARRARRSPRTTPRAGASRWPCGSRRSPRYAGENGAPVRRAASSETADLLADLVAEGVRTLAFVRSRRGAEQVALTAAGLLAEVDPSLPARVAAYRGGYLPEERRALEAALRRGDLLGLAATNALELGIDISGLDAVLVAGFPGTRAALWQQVGRAGRRRPGRARRPGRPRRPAGHVPRQPSRGAVRSARRGHGLRPDQRVRPRAAPVRRGPGGPADGGRPAAVRPDRRATRSTPSTDAGLLRRRPRGWFWTDSAAGQRPGRHPVFGRRRPVQLVEESHRPGRRHRRRRQRPRHRPPGRGLRAPGRDLAGVRARPGRSRRTDAAAPTVDYSTTAREVTEITIGREQRAPALGRLPVVLRHGRGDPPDRRPTSGGDSPAARCSARSPWTCRPGRWCTSAVWWTVPEADWSRSGLSARDLPGAAHAAEHCSIGLLPLFATCDRWDIGGVSTPCHPDTGQLTVFVYDGHPGGAGFAERGFAAAREWLTATRETIAVLRLRERLPLVRAVPQVRQPEPPAGQVRSRCPAGPAAGPPTDLDAGSRHGSVAPW